ncbi:MAG: hypothetical protein GIW95_08290 [Candidatus Eremiobacteraeota bacterium]|nr:hypothetical protein [Candidatus Eremiobacteraeota bacterium]
MDPSSDRFAFDDAAYARLRRRVAETLRGDEARIVLSCSVYNGFAGRLEADLGVQVERSDEAGIHDALAYGPHIGLAVSYPPSYAVIERRLREVGADRGGGCEPLPLLGENAFAFADDEERYAAALGEATREGVRPRGLDCVFLAQFSMDPFAARIAQGTSLPVVSALAATLGRLAP